MERLLHYKCLARKLPLNLYPFFGQRYLALVFDLLVSPLFFLQVTYNYIFYFYAGYNRGYTDVLINGDLENFKAVLYYCKGNDVVAVATVGSDPIAAQFANLLVSGRTLSKCQVIDNKWLTDEEDTVVCTRL